MFNKYKSLSMIFLTSTLAALTISCKEVSVERTAVGAPGTSQNPATASQPIYGSAADKKDQDSQVSQGHDTASTNALQPTWTLISRNGLRTDSPNTRYRVELTPRVVDGVVLSLNGKITNLDTGRTVLKSFTMDGHLSRGNRTFYKGQQDDLILQFQLYTDSDDCRFSWQKPNAALSSPTKSVFDEVAFTGQCTL